MKLNSIKLKLAALAALFCLAIMGRAGTFADNFDVSHNYISQGVPGTGWDGMSIGILTIPAADVTTWNANVVASGSLSIRTAGGAQADYGDSPFMWKTVTGDFTNIVHVTDYQNSIYQIVGLLARDPDETTGNWIYIGDFELFPYLTWDVRDTTGGTSAEASGLPGYVVEGDVSTYPRWLKLTRVGTQMSCSVSTNGVVWDDVYTSDRTDFPATMQVGIFDSTFDTGVCSAQLQNFSLSGPNVEISTPPAQASGLTLTTNLDGTYDLSWTAGAGSDGSVVVMRNGPIFRQPLDGVAYTGNASFGSGDRLDNYETLPNYVVYSGSGSSVTVSGLTPGLVYNVAVYSYSGNGASTVYNLANPPTAATPVQTLGLGLTTTNLLIRATVAHPTSQATAVAGYGSDAVVVTVDPRTVFASSSPAIATVNSSGLVTAVAPGAVDITATFGGITATQAIVVASASGLLVNTNELFMAALTDVLPPSGATGNWTNFVPIGGVMTPMGASPTVYNFGGANFEKNLTASANGYLFTNYTGFPPIPANGVTFAAAVRPMAGPSNGDRGEIVDVFYNQAGFGIQHDNQQVVLTRNNGDFTWEGTGCYLPIDQVTVVSLVINADGSYLLYTNGLLAATGAAAGAGLTSLTPGSSGRDYANYINVGRNNPDGWTAFNGYLGDVYFYTNVISETDRVAVEDNLINKFILQATNAFNISASVGANGTISPSGDISVLQGNDQMFTFTPDVDYVVQDVVVDGVSIGFASSYTFSNVSSNHTIAVSFASAMNYTIDAAAGVGGSISPSGTTTNGGASTPTFTITADTGYKVNQVLVDGLSQGERSSYTFAPLTTNHTISVSFSAVGWPLPKSDQLILAAVTDGFTHSNGAVIGNWPTFVPTTGPSPTNLTPFGGATPTVVLVGGENYFHSDRVAPSSGYQYYPGSGYTNPIPSSGATVVAVIKPTLDVYDPENGWDALVSMFSGQFGVGVDNNDGEINVSRNNKGAPAITTGVYLPDGQITVLSVVMQANGNFILFTNGVGVFTNTDVSSFTLTPGAADWQQRIFVGRRNQYDGWTEENGEIGDVYLYRTALSDADRQLVESNLMAKFIYSATNIWTITASTAGSGTITPFGASMVNQGYDQFYTIAANPGNYLANILVDGIPVGPMSSYTFNAVAANHTIAASFAAGSGPSLSPSLSAGTMNMSWLNLGWILQTQTNANAAGLGTDWVDVPGSSAVTNMSFGTGAAENSFFRLRAP